MLRPEFLGRIRKRHHPALISVLPASAECGKCLGALQAFEHDLIALGVLDHELSASVDSEDKRSLVLLEATNVVFDVALELSY